MSFDPIESSEISPAEKTFLSGADRRMRGALWVLGIAGTVIFLAARGWRWAGGFAIGSLLSSLNFRWMNSAASAISDLAAPPETPHSEPHGNAPQPATVVTRFVLRYALIAVAAYVIFKSSFVSLGAFFLGLFVFLAAILVEVGYEVYAGFR